jgi:hypothetical protein
VSEDGFDFGPSPPRREARRFEPPPWELEQFECRAREQAEREKVSPEAVGSEAAGNPGEGPGDDTAEEASRDTESGTKAQIDEKQVAMMMLELRTEEPPTLTGVWMVILGAGVVVAFVGVVVAIWGVLALVRLGRTGALGGMVLLVFGLTFAGIGGGLIYKALRQRGVL